jgi:ATP/maltotriose-dependent transcriptional regulator MalT
MAHQAWGTDVLDTKLFPSSGTARPLPRQRLQDCREVLDGAYPVTLVVAPAGYGKSTLMASWHASLVARAQACAWLSLDTDDNDLARFMRHLVAALRKADMRIGAWLGDSSGIDFGADAKATLERLAADLTSLQRRIVLFLDDLQFVTAADAIAVVDWLANYAPRCLQQVIGSREDVPGIRLASLRVRHLLFDVDAKRLQFGAEEAARFFRDRLGRELTPRQLQPLLDKTEGWPAALELAAIALAEASQADHFIERFTGSDSAIVDYLGEIVLSTLDERTRGFVLRIAMADRVSAPLARVLSGDDNAEVILGSLRARRLFLIPLNRDGTWLRFHHLVGEFFRDRFGRLDPVGARECLLRAASWLHARGQIEEAIAAAIRAEDWARACEWIASSVEELVFHRGQHQTILRWMSALPEAWVDRHPAIRTHFVFALAFHPQLQAYEAQIHRLTQSLQEERERQTPDAGRVDELSAVLEFQDALSLALRDEGLRAGEAAKQWLARWPQAPLERQGVMGNVLAFGHKTSGRVGDGLAALDAARLNLERTQSWYSLGWSAFVGAVLQLKGGAYLEARRACLDGIELLDKHLHGHPAHASLLHALLGAVAYEFDEIPASIGHIEQAMDLITEYGTADALVVAFTTQARLQRLRQDDESALTILREGQELGERRHLRRVAVTLAAEECNHLCRAHRHDEARVVASRFGFNRLPGRATPRELSSEKALRAASRYLLRQAPQLVAAGLGDAIEDSRQRGFAHRRVELLLLRALAHHQQVDWVAALADLQQALMIAAPRRYQRVFLDEAVDLRPLFERVDPEKLRGTEGAPLARRLQQLMRANGGQVGPVTASNSGAALDELTKREIAILKRLESGLSNKEIAEAIFISEGTLKWHLHNVYSKLGVKNRSGAILKAKAAGIL